MRLFDHKPRTELDSADVAGRIRLCAAPLCLSVPDACDMTECGRILLWQFPTPSASFGVPSRWPANEPHLQENTRDA